MSPPHIPQVKTLRHTTRELPLDGRNRVPETLNFVSAQMTGIRADLTHVGKSLHVKWSVDAEEKSYIQPLKKDLYIQGNRCMLKLQD